MSSEYKINLKPSKILFR